MTDTRADGVEPGPLPLPRRIATVLFYASAAVFFAYLARYYVTGAGGPSLLAIQMVPLAVALVYLNDARKGVLYPRFGAWGGVLVAVAALGVCIAAAIYLVREFEAIRIYRIGLWNTQDLLAGTAIVVLVMEYTRRKYLPLFFVILGLVLYTVYGHYVPGMFQHPGISWYRLGTSLSLEMTTGVFERLPQLALTLIGSFILVLSVLQAFDCIGSILKASTRLAVRSPKLLPQAAVIGSFGVAAVSGSGAANAATTGTATIPVLIKAGFPRVKAAAVETATSLGGQLMPPLMGIAAFMMAEFMGVSYFDVVARGFGPAIIYFIGVSVAVYLLAVQYQSRTVVPEVEPMRLLDWVNIAAYFLAVAGLIYLMGWERRPAMTSAQTVFVWLLVGLSVLFLGQRLWARRFALRDLIRPFGRLIETFALTTAELTVLLATLGILTATFTITGVPTKVGVLLMEVAQVHIILMVLVAFAFGYLVGMGLPVAPTYIIVAVVIAPFMIRAGVDPWVVHFFAFFVAVFGELSPPTSVTAAVTSRIAGSPFVATMMHALGLCLPLIIMMAAVFTRPELVLEPGMAQLVTGVLVTIGTLGVTFALNGKFHGQPGIDRSLRALLAAVSLAALLHPDDGVAWIMAAVVVVGLAAGLLRAMRVRREILARAEREAMKVQV